MTIVVRTGSGLLDALNSIANERIERAVTTAQREIAVYAFEQWTSGKFTWSFWQKDKVWSGQARESVTVSVGNPSTQYATPIPGPWPDHPNPYAPRDPFEARFKLENIPAWQTVYVSDAAPHASKVEAHTNIMHASAEFTLSHFQNYSWHGVLQTSSAAPF